jgi:hypothetical protein
MTARRASTLAVASVLGSALLVIVLAIWASSIGPSRVLRGDGPEPAGTPTATNSSTTPSPDAAPPPATQDSPSHTAPLFRALAILVNVLAVSGDSGDVAQRRPTRWRSR